jgi:hypothetical protein
MDVRNISLSKEYWRLGRVCPCGNEVSEAKVAPRWPWQWPGDKQKCSLC